MKDHEKTDALQKFYKYFLNVLAFLLGGIFDCASFDFAGAVRLRPLFPKNSILQFFHSGILKGDGRIAYIPGILKGGDRIANANLHFVHLLRPGTR